MHVIQSIASVRRDHGGPSRSVPALCEALTQAQVNVHLLTGVSARHGVENNFPSGLTQIHACNENAYLGRFRLAYAFKEAIRAIARASGTNQVVVHDHGVWLATNHAVSVSASKLGLLRIVSPRGMLSLWSLRRRKWTKRILWQLYQKRDFKSANGFHATSDSEAQDIRRLGFTQPIAIVPNGLDVPKLLPDRRRTEKRKILLMSRIHPVKGIMELVRAFHVAKVGAEWELLIVGPDEGGYAREVKSLVSTLELSKQVTIAAPVNDKEKWQFFVDADLFVLPSFTENYGIAVAEAMSAGLPVITTTGTPWRAIAEKNIGWWVEPTVSALELALKSACALSRQNLDQMGLRAQEFARQQYSWSDVASQLKNFYGELRQPRNYR